MFRVACILTGLSCLFVLELQGQEQERYQIEIEGPVVFDWETQVATATNSVTVSYRGAVLSAEKATIDYKTGEIQAEGQVHLQRQGQLWTGNRIRYNFKTSRMSGEDFRTGQAPLFAEGGVLVADQPAGVYVLANGALTTDDYAKPAYRIRTKTLVVVPGEYVEARHATLLLGHTPVFYFPYFRRSLKDHGNHFSLTPGYRSVDGPYLLTTYNWYWNERLDGALHLDGRVKRGLGAGPDFNWHLPLFGEGTFKGYYAHDQDPGLDRFDEEIESDRYRLSFSDFSNPRTNLTVKAVARYQSDSQVVRDFFESEYHKNIQPSTYLELDQSWSNFGLNLLAQPRVNDFYDTVERLPEVKLTGLRQRIGLTPLFYESESSAGWYQREFADNLTNRFSAVRADTYHQVLLPWTFFNWLNVAPRAGGRFTHYGETDGEGTILSEADRWVFNTGAEVSFKASRVWPGLRNRFLELDGLRHIIQPSVNYAYFPNPSADPSRLPQFDYLVPTTRLLPITFPDFNSIDAIESENVIRWGLQNKLQTKRQGQIDNLVNWALYLDWRLNPRPGQRTYSNVYSDLDLKPFSWLTLSSQLRFDVNENLWREVNHMVTFTPQDRWSLSLGQRYLRENDPLLGPDPGNNLYFSSLYFRFTDNWGVRMTHRFEANDGTLEEQDYTLYRDLRSWTAALTFRVRDQRDGPTDFTAAITFSLKAFPRFGLGDDVNKPSLLLGY
jgi:LPS-assembly protein